MQGDDPRDAACTPAGFAPTLPGLDDGIAGLRIAIAGGYFAQGGMPVAHAAVATVAAALGVTRSIDVPGAAQARAAAFLITASEGAALHLDRIRTRPGDFDPDVRDRLIAGAMIPAAWVTKAQKLRRHFHARMQDLFGDVDLLLAPATPYRAPRIGQKTMVLGGVEMPVRPNLGIYTQPISCIGLPVVAVPVWTDGIALPIGVQVIAPPWREDLALRAAAVLEAQGVCRAPVAR
jgi:aspartyl-tRNA(Asn)/glutamyl-tRNA(Gln) amidotransferase subunit A